MPDFAARPAVTLAIANAEPTEISISPVRITTVIPIATISTGAFARKRSIRLRGEKYPGAMAARAAHRITIAPATAISRVRILRMPQGEREDVLLRRFVARKNARQPAGTHYSDSIAHPENLR